VALGHEVEVFAGQPYPLLDGGVRLTPLPGLDLYRQPDPWRTPAPEEFRDWIDVGEFAGMRSGGYPEPAAFSLRARRALRSRRADFDLVHDNQSLGFGLLGMIADGWPVIATMHHPITVDRALDYAHVSTDAERESVRRWYGFVDMQIEVAAQVPKVLTVSRCSAEGLATEMGVAPERISVVPVGVDCEVFRPAATPSTPGLILATASADSPLKGLVPLVEALAKVRTEHPHAHLTIVGRARLGSPAQQTIERLGLERAVEFTGPLEAHQIVELYERAEMAVVPSLYEGFSLPAVESMACGVPLVATTGGALPEVVGPDGEAALVVAPNDPSALAAAMGRVLGDAVLRARLGAAGRERVLKRFTWQATAQATAAEYERLLQSC
jgi:glycosyltransferase involved in cell wall biosynthesis